MSNQHHEHNFSEIDVNLIDPNPFQPRRHVDKYQDAALLQDIKERGVLQPVGVVSCGDRYMLIFGHRRLNAVRELGLVKIPAMIVSSAGNPLEVAIVENMLRVNMNALEQAEAYSILISQGFTQKKLSDVCGLSIPSVNGILKIIRIPKEIRDDCYKHGHLGQKFLVALSRFGNAEIIREAYRYFLEMGKLPSRQTRLYNDEEVQQKSLLANIREVVSQLKDMETEYAEEGTFQEGLAKEIAALHKILLQKGWFLPKQITQKFDASNRVTI